MTDLRLLTEDEISETLTMYMDLLYSEAVSEGLSAAEAQHLLFSTHDALEASGKLPPFPGEEGEGTAEWLVAAWEIEYHTVVRKALQKLNARRKD